MTQKKKVGRFSGMTKNNLPGKIKKKTRKVSSRKKIENTYQASTKTVFMQVKDGETFEEWKKRTNRRRILDVPKVVQHVKVDGNSTLSPSKQKFKNKEHAKRFKQITMQVRQKPFEFLKGYALIMQWASVRYGIVKDDIEIGYYFYDSLPFSQKDFNDYCIALGTVRGVFRRFYNNGYITPILVKSMDGSVKETKYYTISVEMNIILGKVYGLVSKNANFSVVDIRHAENRNEMIQFLNKLSIEIDEFITGLKTPEVIRMRNEEDKI